MDGLFPAEETKPDYGQVNTTQDNVVWLVKVPNFLYDEWMRAPKGANLGSLTVEASTTSNAVKMSCQANVGGDIPTAFQLEGTQQTQPTYIISDAGGTEQDLVLHGRVASKMNMTAVDTAAFSRVVRGRATARDEMKGAQAIHMPGTEEKKFLLTAPPPVSKAAIQASVALFTKQEYWGLKDINTLLLQPENYLREVLNELCTYNTSGKQKNTFELKPEFRTGPKKEDPAAPTADTKDSSYGTDVKMKEADEDD